MRQQWSQREDSFLRMNWNKLPNIEIAHRLDRSLSSVQHRAQRLEIKKFRLTRQVWTPEESRKLHELYPTQTREKLLEVFEGRGWAQIRNKARLSGIPRKRVANNEEDCLTLTREERGYLAGLIDGEGHITIIRGNHKGTQIGYSLTPVVGIANTSPEIVKFLKEKGNFYAPVEQPLEHIQRGKIIRSRRPIYRFRITGPRCLGLLKEVYPFLLVKRKQAELVIEFCKDRLNQPYGITYSSRQLEIIKEIHCLNRG